MIKLIMEKKINIAELLKNCPNGMELDCAICSGVIFIEVDSNPKFPIVVRANNGYVFSLTKYGQVHNIDDAKCVIFPKGKTTWEGFVPPIGFKDGDIVSTRNGIWIGIVKKPVNCAYETYITINGESLIYDNPIFCFERFATEEEKQKLFSAIKANGYKWNSITKTLEKLVEPKFKVGDKIKKKYSNGNALLITDIENNYYIVNVAYDIGINMQDQYELVSDKFDITTLEPFDKVLVRCADNGIWNPQFFSNYRLNSKFPFVCTYNSWAQCIPYNEDTKHLANTTNDCNDYYKTWE